MATERTHEFLLAGDESSYNRLGFRYTEGQNFMELLHPDSELSEETVKLPFDAVTELARFLADVLPIFEGTMQDEVKD